MYSINFKNIKCPNCGGRIICLMKDINTGAIVECGCKKCDGKDFYKDYIVKIDGNKNLIIEPKK